MDGFLVGDFTGQCKRGMDIAYRWDLGLSRPGADACANTGEVLSIVNRPGNRPSRTGGRDAGRSDLAGGAASAAAFAASYGDAKFSQSEHFGPAGTTIRGSTFSSASRRLPKICGPSPTICRFAAWLPMQRARPATTVKTTPRQRRGQRQGSRGGGQGVREPEAAVGGGRRIQLHRPGACRKTYRMVVVKKNISVEKGENAASSIVGRVLLLHHQRTG